MRALVCTLLFCVGSTAWAEEVSSRAAAQRIIDEANVGDLFVAVEDEHPTVRHTASGLECTFFLDGERSGRLHLYDSRPRGDDVSCEMRGPGETTSLYATRYAEGASLREQLDGAEAAILHRYPDARRRTPELTVTLDGVPPHEERHYFITLDGVRHLSVVSVALVGEWVIKLRYTATAPDQDMLTQRSIMAGMIMVSTLMEITDERGAD